MEYKLGKMNCYCQHMYNTYGDSGYKLIFADGEQYCRQWFNAYSQNQYQ